MSVLNRIKEISKDRGLTLKEVARKAGIGENSIYKWKTTSPSTKSLEKVAKVLGVTVEDLMSDSGDKQTPEYRAIQRKAKELSPVNQKKLLDMIETIFGDIDKGDD